MINFKDFKNINNIHALVEAIDVPVISDDTNFWLVRTEAGVFYDEYVSNGFVALGWNDLLPSHIAHAKKDKASKDSMLEAISQQYDTKQPGMVFNKCDRFINEIKDNDIFMIPDRSNNEITFAIAGQYYEEYDLNTTEAEFIAFKETGWAGTFQDKDCPYVKRRKITILKSIPGAYINPNLFKALISYHGLSDVNDYGNDILSSIHPIYIYRNRLSTVFRVMAKSNVDALSYSSFIYNSTKQINLTEISSPVSVKSNVNSPGNIILDFALNTKDAITTALPYIVVIWICLSGGKILGFEINSIIKSISDSLNDKEGRRKTRAEAKSLEIDNESKEIDLDVKRDFYQAIQHVDPNLLKEIASTAEPLDIDISEFARIIDLANYKKNRDND